VTNAVKELAAVVGEHRVSVHPSDLHRHAFDSAASALISKREGQYGLPTCVVRPHSTEQVAQILKWADRTKTPVVPYGGGSGVCGGIEGADVVIIEMRSLEEILAFDETSLLVTAQAGVAGSDLMKSLRSWGCMLGHEPQSLNISTIGGWVATRASGQLSARYGGVEDLIAGLEAVLPGGHVVRSKIGPRRAVGPDLTSLLIGSEGTLGIVTEVTFRVVRIPEDRVDLCIRFEHMADGVAACRALSQSDLGPTLVRLYDREDTRLLLRNRSEQIQGCVLLLSFDGRDAAGRAVEAEKLCAGETTDEGIVSSWWEHRNDAVDDYHSIMAGEGVLGPHAAVDTMEVSGTWSILRDLYHSMKNALSSEADVAACHLSHIYRDGACLYFTLASACDDDDQARTRVSRWWDVGMRSCLEAGGSISHHHGIGRLKAPWMRDELGGWFEVLAAVKKAIDPHGIMNPGALGL
jgi:alkyldihydroxyacetonephosphate synthase